ncbi:MAG: DUF1841 family protein [Steroidobacteraceae bacterium]
MLFGNSREALRRGWLDAFKKAQRGALLTALESQLVDLIREHPEYHDWLERGDEVLQTEFAPEGGRTNPFLHLSMHLALREQVSTNRPQGITRIHATLASRRDQHAAEHQMMEALGKALWEAQRAGRTPDERAYLEDLERLVTSASERTGR